MTDWDIMIKMRRLEITIEVFRVGGRVFKQLPKYNADNEIYFLEAMQDSGYVPFDPIREGVELISMEYVHSGHVTDPEAFMAHFDKVIDALRAAGIRHGDLTEYSVLVRNNRPVIIDFAESRTLLSPIQSKRPEGDSYWLRKTMEKLAYGH